MADTQTSEAIVQRDFTTVLLAMKAISKRANKTHIQVTAEEISNELQKTVLLDTIQIVIHRLTFCGDCDNVAGSTRDCTSCADIRAMSSGSKFGFAPPAV